MKVYSFWDRIQDGDSKKRLLQGFVVGSVITMIVGFTMDGWNRGTTVEQKIASASQSTIIKTLAPICADKYLQAAKSDAGMKAKLESVNSWNRDQYLYKTGWATFPGGKDPDMDVAQACAEILRVSLKLK